MCRITFTALTAATFFAVVSGLRFHESRTGELRELLLAHAAAEPKALRQTEEVPRVARGSATSPAQSGGGLCHPKTLRALTRWPEFRGEQKTRGQQVTARGDKKQPSYFLPSFSAGALEGLGSEAFGEGGALTLRSLRTSSVMSFSPVV